MATSNRNESRLKKARFSMASLKSCPKAKVSPAHLQLRLRLPLAPGAPQPLKPPSNLAFAANSVYIEMQVSVSRRRCSLGHRGLQPSAAICNLHEILSQHADSASGAENFTAPHTPFKCHGGAFSRLQCRRAALRTRYWPHLRQQYPFLHRARASNLQPGLT